MLLSTLKITATVFTLGFSSIAYAQTDWANVNSHSVVHAKKIHKLVQIRKRLTREIVVTGTVDRRGVSVPTFKAVLPEITLEFPEHQVYISS